MTGSVLPRDATTHLPSWMEPIGSSLFDQVTRREISANYLISSNECKCGDCTDVSGVCFTGREWSDWSSELRIPGDELKWKFTSDGSVNGWGWRLTVYPIMPAAGEPFQAHTHSCVITIPNLKSQVLQLKNLNMYITAVTLSSYE